MSELRLLNIELNNKIVDLNRGMNDFKTEIADLKQDKIDLMNELNVLIKRPELHPELYETDNVYKGDRVYFTSKFNYKYKLPKMQDYFCGSRKMVDDEVKKVGIKPEWTELRRFREIIYYVATHYEYYYDWHKFGEGIEENWESIENLIVTKRGDCETMTMLVVMMMRASGIPSNRIFMADGLYVEGDQEFGHAFPVFWNDKWYIGEPTNHSQDVRTWDDLRFKYYCLWGMGNDHFSVKIKGDKTFL